MTEASTIAELLLRRRGDSGTGLVFEDATWTWDEVVDECAGRASVLAALRRPGPFHVGVLLDNVPEYLFVLGGAALAGAVVVGVNPTRRGEELARDIRHTDCQVVVTDAEHRALLDGLDLGLPDDRVLTIDGTLWSALVAAHRGAPPPAALPGPDAMWLLIFTSGSTGAPKAVIATQGRQAQFGRHMGFGPDDVLYCAMPLFHGNALNSNVIPAIACGATIALRRRFSASAFLPDVRRFGATFFNTVGRALSYILATPPSEHDRDHSLKVVLGPESSRTDARAFRERFGVPVIQGYGSSEGAIRMTPVRTRRAGALGTPEPGADVAIVDPETLEECPLARFDDDGLLANATEAIGEIVRRDGVRLFEGYYNNDEANAERTRNGWFWSGDLGYRDEEGVFYFAGRTADWLRVDGENFAAAPVERIVERHPDVAGVAVYAVPDPVTGDRVMAAIELVPGATFDGDAFHAFLIAQPDLGTKWLPRFVRVVDALPTTATGKLDKKPLRAAAWLPPGEVWTTDGRDPYRRLTDDAASAIVAELERNGRRPLLPLAE